MERNVDQEVSKNVAELKNYLRRGIESSEGVDLVRAVEMLKQCECVSREDGPVIISCVVTILSLL